MEIPPGTTLGRYKIRSKIGAGGMGEVYLAQDTTELDRTVALKVLPGEVGADRDRLQRFTREARTVSNLNHPNILTIYEFGQADSVRFIATEFIDGETLRQHFSGRRLKLTDVLDISHLKGALLIAFFQPLKCLVLVADCSVKQRKADGRDMLTFGCRPAIWHRLRGPCQHNEWNVAKTELTTTTNRAR